MENIGYWLQVAMRVLNIPITACGWTFTLQQWLLYIVVAGFVLTFIIRLLK